MQERGAKPGKIRNTVIWYDLSTANVKTNLAEDARQAFDRILVGPKGARRLTGIAESDAPTEVEQIRAYGQLKGDPYLATYGLAEAKNIEWDKVGKTQRGPGADSNGDKPEVGPGTGPSSKSPTPKSNTPRKNRPA